MQQILGNISVANSGYDIIYSFKNTKLYVPNYIPSYNLISAQEQAFYTDILLCLEARKASHNYVVNSFRRQINYIVSNFNQDTRTFKDLPLEVRRNMSRTMQLSFSFTEGHNQAPPIFDNTSLTVLRGNLQSLKYDAKKPLTSLEHAI